MKDAFEGEESKGDLDMISNLIVWIYQTDDVEKLEQMLQLAMTTGEIQSPDKLALPEPSRDEQTISDLSTSVTTPATPATGGNQANTYQIAMLNQKIEELQREKTQADEEKRLADEEITQLTKDIQ